jgi:hypothetical protein
MIIGMARIEGVYNKADIHAVRMQHWAVDGVACLVFDVIIKLHEPVSAARGLNTWTMKPSTDWTCPPRLTKGEATMSQMELDRWCKTQEATCRIKALEKHIALVSILQGSATGWTCIIP